MQQPDYNYLEKLITSSASAILRDFGGIKGRKYAYRRGTLPILLVAHADTVFSQKPVKDIICKSKDVWCSPITGFGADDRAGVYIVSKIKEQLDCSVLITDEEEIGGGGAHRFIEDSNACGFLHDYLAVIEFDRRGSRDAVFYQCDNRDFAATVCAEYYQAADGSFSDISIIAPELGIAAVNLSCGYYGEHSHGEYLIISQMLAAIDHGKNLIERLVKDGKKYEYVTLRNNYIGRGFGTRSRYRSLGGYSRRELVTAWCRRYDISEEEFEANGIYREYFNEALLSEDTNDFDFGRGVDLGIDEAYYKEAFYEEPEYFGDLDKTVAFEELEEVGLPEKIEEIEETEETEEVGTFGSSVDSAPSDAPDSAYYSVSFRYVPTTAGE
jgi:hypothetical protein